MESTGALTQALWTRLSIAAASIIFFLGMTLCPTPCTNHDVEACTPVWSNGAVSQVEWDALTRQEKQFWMIENWPCSPPYWCGDFPYTGPLRAYAFWLTSETDYCPERLAWYLGPLVRGSVCGSIDRAYCEAQA